MIDDIRKDRETFKLLLDGVIASDDKDTFISMDEALKKAIEMIVAHAKIGGKLFFIGNGGSASIASHLSTDFVKNAGIPAMAFNDSSLLTCISNDLGYERVFKEPLEMFAGPKDVLIAISSSGKSENILSGVRAAKAKGARVITFSGFDKDNPLRKSGEVNFYVPLSDYGHVEVMHLYLCHCLVNIIIKNKAGLNKKAKML